MFKQSIFSKNRIFYLVAGLAVFSSSAQAFPYNLSYSRKLTETSDKPFAGPVTIKIDFYTAADLPPNAICATARNAGF